MPNIQIGKELSGKIRHVLGQGRRRGNNRPPGQQSCVAWMAGQGFGFEVKTQEDAELAYGMMEFAAANQTSQTKRCEQICCYLTLSWHPDEQPTPAEMEAAGGDALKALGMEKALALFVARNTERACLHIVACRINPETGRTFSDRYNWLAIQAWALEYEQRSGVIRCPRRAAMDWRILPRRAD